MGLQPDVALAWTHNLHPSKPGWRASPSRGTRPPPAHGQRNAPSSPWGPSSPETSNQPLGTVLQSSPGLWGKPRQRSGAHSHSWGRGPEAASRRDQGALLSKDRNLSPACSQTEKVSPAPARGVRRPQSQLGRDKVINSPVQPYSVVPSLIAIRRAGCRGKDGRGLELRQQGCSRQQGVSGTPPTLGCGRRLRGVGFAPAGLGPHYAYEPQAGLGIHYAYEPSMCR